MARILPGAACLLLAAFVGLNHSILPVPWPDEALFSSPAAELAANRPFSTPVLSGLIYGMDRATLWNCPLHMVLLAQLYRITGESLLAGRLFSLFLGLSALMLFYFLCRRVLSPLKAGAAAVILALDPVFQRASNTIRMDVLTLALFFACLLLILEARETARRNRSLVFAFLAGLAAGLAAISHPFAAILAPVLLLFCLPRVERTAAAAAGAATGFAPWGVYILTHFDIFHEQFIEQLRRKAAFAKMITGGETGGLHRVYFSQYGFYDGSWPAMVAGAALYGVVLAACALYLYSRLRKGALLEPAGQRRSEDLLLVSFLLIAGFAYFSSEGWYVVYGDAFLILSAGILSLRSRPWILPAAGAAFLGLSLYFTARSFTNDTRAQTDRFLKDSAATLAGCKSVYVRVRPDPYFDLRKDAPSLRVLEFIPGKLTVKPEHEAMLYGTWDSTDCFLIDQNTNWEPRLTEYLERNAKQFQVTQAARHAPLNVTANLYRRIRVH